MFLLRNIRKIQMAGRCVEEHMIQIENLSFYCWNTNKSAL